MNSPSYSSAVLLSLSSFLFAEPQPTALTPPTAPATTLPAIPKRPEPTRRVEDGVLWRELIVPDSKVTLIHIRNHHLRSEVSPNSPSAERFWKVQTEMLELMERCSERFEIEGLYADGVTDKFIQEYNRQLHLRIASLPKEKPSGIKNILASTSEPILSSGAISAFAISRGMKFSCGESFELHQRAERALKTKGADADDLSLRQREDYQLSCIQRDFPDGNVSVLTNLGAGHRLFDNVAKWNEVNPNFKFSLIEVSPKIVREILDEIPENEKGESPKTAKLRQS